MTFSFSRRTLLLALYLVLCGWPASIFAQDRDTLKGGIAGIDVVRELAEQYPEDWRCAHVERPPCDPYAFVHKLASYIYYELKDTRVGLNRRRGDGPLSWDALAILDPNGDTVDANGGRSFVIDFCGSCGTGNHNPVWSSVGGRSGWQQPKFMGGTLPPPPGNGGGAPPPPPPTNDVKAILEKLSAQETQLAALAEEIRVLRGENFHEIKNIVADIKNLADRVEAAHESVLIAIDLGKQVLDCSWVGSTKAFGGSLTLRCQP